MNGKRVAIIGAGITGLTLAQQINGNSHVSFFEKSRGVGGRMSTRYTNDFQFDHGAQYFTARSESFQAFLKPFIKSGIVKIWDAKVTALEKSEKPMELLWNEPHYIAVPTMSSLCKALINNQEIHLNTTITKLLKSGTKWKLVDQENKEHGPFDWVCCTAPATQAIDILPFAFKGTMDLSSIKMQGCFSLMMGFTSKFDFHWDAALVKNSLLGWIAIDSSKPGRTKGSSLLIQSTNEWCEVHMEEDLESITRIMKQEFETVTGVALPEPAYQSIHRWRYANTLPAAQTTEKQKLFYIDPSLHLISCGDWCVRGRVESGFLSGVAAGRELIGYL